MSRFSQIKRCVVAALLLITGFAHAQSSDIQLVNSVPKLIALPLNSIASKIYFDLPAGVTRFKVELVGAPGSGDIDLFLRQGQDFIVSNTYGEALSFSELSEYAQAWSISDLANEAILVGAHSPRPPVEGRYYLVLINGGAATTATLKLTQNPPITPTQIRVAFDIPLACPPSEADCECNLSPWSDGSTAGFFAPGNPGLTLGDKRKNAAIAAAQSLANQISSESPILVQACWSSKLKTGETRAVLAAAGPDRVIANSPEEFRFPFLVPSHTWFAVAPTVRAAGTSRCQVLGGDCIERPQITIFFNSLIDTPEGLGASSFYYGTTGTAPTRDIDFASVATHELTHGLGYIDLVDELGVEERGMDDAFSRNLINAADAAPKSFARLNVPERLAALTSNNVQWVGPQALLRSGSRVLPGDSGLRMYAPTTLETGSSISHLDTASFAQELMAPSYARGNRSLGVALGQLYDLGFAPGPRTPPAKPIVYAGNWYDPAHSGHGFDIEPAGRANGFDRVFVTTYSYDAQGLPEYFISLGQLVDGTFLADSQTSSTGVSTSFARYRQVNGAAERVPDIRGRLRIDFNDAAASEACSKGAQAEGQAVVRITDGSDVSNWCLQQLVGRNSRPAADFTGHWYDQNNPGWGVGIVNAVSDGKVIVSANVYYFDVSGVARWAYAQSNDFVSGAEIPMFQRNGFCRNCAPVPLVPIPAGFLRLSLGNVEGLSGQPNKISFSITLRGGAGGTFSRTDAPLVRLVEKPRELQ